MISADIILMRARCAYIRRGTCAALRTRASKTGCWKRCCARVQVWADGLARMKALLCVVMNDVH